MLRVKFINFDFRHHYFQKNMNLLLLIYLSKSCGLVLPEFIIEAFILPIAMLIMYCFLICSFDLSSEFSSFKLGIFQVTLVFLYVLLRKLVTV